MGSATLRTDVLVVGAGPTGLMAANWLDRLGVDALAIDAKSGPTRESRALGVQARTMEIYRQLGVVDAVRERVVLATELRPGVGRRALGSVPLGRLGYALTPFPGLHILEQSANEEILAGRLAERGRPVLWDHAFASLSRTGPGDAAEEGPGVRVSVRGPDGPVAILARYVVAADGASSPVRESLGIGFRGRTNAHVFYVLDANGVTGSGSGINLRVSAEDFMLAFPMGPDGRGGRRYRLLGIVRDDGGAPSAGPAGHPTGFPAAGAGDTTVDEARARASLAEEFGFGYTDAQWFATYRVHHRVADVFRAGGVFLAGDAAHIHSPVGAQGMNTGLQDAHNLACKLADVLAGRMPEAYLDRYEAERRPVALRLVGTTDRAFSVITSTGRLARLVRTVVLPALWPVGLRVVPRSPAGGRLFGYLSQIRIHYWMTEGERRRADAARGPARWTRRGKVLGRRLPWVSAGEHGGADNHAALGDAAWQVHAYGPRAAAKGVEVAARHALPLRRFDAAPARNLPDGTVVVVRPDMFVAELHPPEPAGRHRRRRRG
ncbi:MAG: FAD-dependent monooxygenase [Arthrobacter sp.]|uniref:FAD-dependent monooxygenase n=1 Tax=Arthrobacter sp. TaxID=1667 RepID=UPI00347F0F61